MTSLKSENGFYPANQRILNYLKEESKGKYSKQTYSENETYPLEFVLIGYQSSENKCYYQKFTFVNQPQKSYIFDIGKKYGSIIRFEDFKCENIDPDYILNSNYLDKMKEFELKEKCDLWNRYKRK